MYINRGRGSKEGSRGEGVRGGSKRRRLRGVRGIVREEVRGIVRLTYINREILRRFRCSADVYVPLWAVR